MFISALVWLLAQAPSPAASLDEGFEHVDVPNAGIYANGWTRVDNSEPPLRDSDRGHGWHASGFVNFEAYDAPNSSMVMAAGPEEIPSSGTVSAWLLSPPIAFGPTFSLAFVARSFRGLTTATGIDRLQVRLCEGDECSDVGQGPDDVGNFGQLLLDINADESDDGFPNTWTAYRVDSGPGVPVNGVGRLAFRYLVHQGGDAHAAGLLGLDRVTVDTVPDQGQGIALSLHASIDDGSGNSPCVGESTLSATRGDKVNLCYAVTNTSTQPLRYHWLRDDVAGSVLAGDVEDLAPGDTRVVQRAITVGHEQPITATATSDIQPSDYRIDDSQAIDYVDIHATGAALTPGSILASPFDFEFYGKRVDHICVRDDATVAVVDGSNCPQQTVGAIPTEVGEYVVNSPFAAVYAERFWPNYGSVFQQVIGSAPDRRLVIQWYQKVPLTVPPATIDPAQGLDAELILHETTNVIEFQYRNTHFGAGAGNDDGGNASIGMQKDLIGLRYAYHQPALATVKRIVWTPTIPAPRVDSRVATIHSLTPDLQLSDASVTASAPSNGAATRILSVANTGSGRLDWRFETPTPAALAPSGDVERAFYTFDLWSSYSGPGYGPLIRFSPEHTNYFVPDGATTIADLDGRLIMAAAFIDDDFTRLYAIDADTRELLRWVGPDQPTARYEVIGTVPLLLDAITGMRSDPTTGTTYLTTSNGTSSLLWRIDTATADVDPVGTISNAASVDDITFDAQGRLYGIDEALDVLLEIDPRTAQASVIGSLGIDAANSSALDFDAATGTLYLITFDQNGKSLYNQLFLVDTTTGAAHPFSDVVGADSALPIALWETLAIAHRRTTCTAPSDVPWVSISPSSGSVAAGATRQDVSVTFDGSGLADGVRTANVCMTSNDPSHRRIAIPLRFDLGGDAIFRSGFDP